LGLGDCNDDIESCWIMSRRTTDDLWHCQNSKLKFSILERLRNLTIDQITERYETFKLMSQFEVPA